MGVGAYVTYYLHLWGPMAQMADAASRQGLDVAKTKLREWLETSDTGRQAMAMSGQQGSRRREHDDISMDNLNGDGKKKANDPDAMDIDDI